MLSFEEWADTVAERIVQLWQGSHNRTKMKNINLIIFLILTIAVLVISCTTTKNIGLLDKPKTYTPVSKELFDSIAQMDSIVFDAANKGNLGN